MRIVYLYTAVCTMGGVDRILTTKANYLAEQPGYEVYIITDSQCGQPFTFPLSNKVKHIDLALDFGRQYTYSLPGRFFYYLTRMRTFKKKLSRLLTELQPDITISTLGREMDFLPSLHDGSIKMGETHAPKQFCRNFHLMEQRGGIHRLMAKYWRRKQEAAVRKLDALVVLTQNDAESWKSVKPAYIFPNPITLRPAAPCDYNAKRILSVGRLTGEKGYDLLIQAWAEVVQKYPDWHLTVYGEGELHDALQQQIRMQGVEASFTLHTPVPHIEEEMARHSLFVLSSRFEGFGLVLIEAMTCGLPVVSFDCPHGPREIIAPEKDGLLVPREDPHALAEAMMHLMEDAELRRQMGEQGQKDIQRYAIDTIMGRWMQLFESLRSKNHKPI
jgi:glycosyltransferase involved in cell wall biosynthesis